MGGIGSRLAMRLLFLTSDGVRGLTSDDGFPIGQFSPAATFNLLVATTAIGVIGAFVYLAVRPSLLGPRWLRVTGCALAAGAVVGSMLVHTTGVDFTLLGPTWLAIALFVAIPALFAALAAPSIEWALRDEGWFQTAPAGIALLPLVVFLFPPLLVLVAIPAVTVAAGHRRLQRSERWSAVVHGPAVQWVVRAAWVAVGIVGIVGLARDTAALL